MNPAQAIRADEHSSRSVPDHIVRYIANSRVTLPQWIGMQDFWRGGDTRHHEIRPRLTEAEYTEKETR